MRLDVTPFQMFPAIRLKALPKFQDGKQPPKSPGSSVHRFGSYLRMQQSGRRRSHHQTFRGPV